MGRLGLFEVLRVEELLEKPYWIIDILPKQVPKDVPPYAVVGGVPAKVIRMQDPSEQRE